MTMPLPQHEPTEQIAKLRLAALPNAVGSARRFVQHQLSVWSLDYLVEDVALVVSELASNSVNATGPLSVPDSYTQLYDAFLSTVILRLRLTSIDLYAEIWDASDELPILTEPATDEENGRGLVLVAEFSDAWGYYPSKIGGKVTWSRWQIKPHETHHSASPVVRRDSAGHFRVAGWLPTRPLREA
jgi:anti-sigma regulatory factor (Ser/Thr protein kinase)